MPWNSNNPDRRQDRSEVPFEAARKQLEYIAREGNLQAALLADKEGLTVVDIESEYDADTFAALSAFLFSVSHQIEQLGEFSRADQFSLTDQQGRTITCRFFELLGEHVVLCIIANDSTDKRAFTDRAIRGIKRIFSQNTAEFEPDLH